MALILINLMEYNMNHINKYLMILFLSAITFGNLDAKVKVVATLPNFASIAKELGGDKVDVTVIAKGYQDPHFVDPKPSFIVKMRKADILIWAGLDLEVGWLPPLLENSRNSKILWGAPGNVDASRGVPLLEVPNIPAAQLRAGGDIHIYGNPHYWMDPYNAKIIAENITDAFIEASPSDKDYFKNRKNDFITKLEAKIIKWEELMKPYAGRKIIAYHNSWPYLEARFGFEIAGFIEPKPGIPPSPRHLVKLIKQIRNDEIRVIIVSPYFNAKPANVISDKIGGRVVKMAPSVGAFDEVQDYFDLFDYNLKNLKEAFKWEDSID